MGHSDNRSVPPTDASPRPKEKGSQGQRHLDRPYCSCPDGHCYAEAIPIFYRARKGSLMDTSSSDRLADGSRSTPSRRDFLHQTAGIAAAVLR